FPGRPEQLTRVAWLAPGVAWGCPRSPVLPPVRSNSSPRTRRLTGKRSARLARSAGQRSFASGPAALPLARFQRTLDVPCHARRRVLGAVDEPHHGTEAMCAGRSDHVETAHLGFIVGRELGQPRAARD